MSTRRRKRKRRLVQHSSESGASSDEEELQVVEAGEVKGQGSGEGVQLCLDSPLWKVGVADEGKRKGGKWTQTQWPFSSDRKYDENITFQYYVYQCT